MMKADKISAQADIDSRPVMSYIKSFVTGGTPKARLRQNAQK